ERLERGRRKRSRAPGRPDGNHSAPFPITRVKRDGQVAVLATKRLSVNKEERGKGRRLISRDPQLLTISPHGCCAPRLASHVHAEQLMGSGARLRRKQQPDLSDTTNAPKPGARSAGPSEPYVSWS